MVPLGTMVLLLVAMTTKHLMADFLLQTASIAKGKAAPSGWALPLALHAGTHAAMTLLVTLAYDSALWWIAPAEFVLHAAIDRAKVIVGRGLRLDPAREGFWWLFGFDQYLHQLTNVGIVVLMLRPALS